MAASGMRVAARSLRERSIRILVSPTPITFAERSSVLQVLEQYGPIDTFMMTPNYHANFISLTRDAATASKLVQKSPLTFQLPAPRPHPNVLYADIGKPRSFFGRKPTVISERGSPTLRKDQNRESHDNGQEQREFSLQIYPSPEYNHESSMVGLPVHHSWPANYAASPSAMTVILKQSLPNALASSGLAYWFCEMRRKTAAGHIAERKWLKRSLPSKIRITRHQKVGQEHEDDAS